MNLVQIGTNEFYPQLIRRANERHLQSQPYSNQKLGRRDQSAACGWRIVISPMIPQDVASCYHSSMRHLVVLFIHLLATLGRLLGPGGVRSLVNTENPVRSENTGVPTIREIIVGTTMNSPFVAFFALLASTFRTRAALQAEILALRHQLAVFQKNGPRRLRLHRCDRLLWVFLYRFWSGWRRCLAMVQPDTVIRWHRKAFAWHCDAPLSRSKPVASTFAFPSGNAASP